MSGFLNRLIHRQVVGDVTHEPSRFVQPRPKSRFETSTSQEHISSADSDLDRHMQTEEKLNKNNELDLEHNVRQQHFSSIKDHVQESPLQVGDLENHPIGKMTSHTGNDQIYPQPEPPHSAIETNPPNVIINNDFPVYSNPYHSNAELGALETVSKFKDEPEIPANEFAQRLENILLQIQGLQSESIAYLDTNPSSADRSGLLTEPGHPSSKSLLRHQDTVPESIDKAIEDIDRQLFQPEQTSTIKNSAYSSFPEIGQQSADSISRVNVNKKRQGSPTEQVVNVTIGRVEVKAVQSSTTEKSQPRKKPSGVMSLDDYMKKRQGRVS